MDALRTPAEAWDLALANDRLVYLCIKDFFGNRLRKSGYQPRRLVHIGTEDDVYQSGLIALYQGMLGWNETKGKISTYGMACIRRRFIDLLNYEGIIRLKHSAKLADFAEKREKARNIGPISGKEGYATLIDHHTPDPLDVLVKQDMFEWSMRALAEFPANRREAFLEYLDGKITFRDLGRKHGVSSQAVQWWINNIRKKMRERAEADVNTNCKQAG